MKPILDAMQSRGADQYMIQTLGLPGIVLMERAAQECFHEIRTRFPDATRFCIVVGPGNNGGDGLALGRMLAGAGFQVAFVRAFPEVPFKGDAGIESDVLERYTCDRITWQDFTPGMEATSDLLIDALFGTGLDRPLEGKSAAIVDWMNSQRIPVLAIDVPSGLSAGTGAILSPAVQATVTLTFQTHKPAHLVTPACLHCGEVRVLDIGIHPEALACTEARYFLPDAEEIASMLKPRSPDTHKGSFGHALIAGGSTLSPGCMALSTQAALASGAGLVSGLVPGAARTAYFSEGWETMLRGPEDDPSGSLGEIHCRNTFLENVTAIGVGPGMGTGNEPYGFLAWLLKTASAPLVLDADALNLLSLHPDLWEVVPEGAILTPHPGEMKRLQPEPDPVTHRLESGIKLAKERRVIVILKGHHSLICLPDGSVYVNTTGNAGMATAGSGDVLTGILTGLLAQGMEPWKAAVAGTWVHGMAGDLAVKEMGMQGLRARDILHHIPLAIRQIKGS